MLTLDQAFAELARLTSSGEATTTKLMALAAQVGIDTAPDYTQGSVTLLYSGEIYGVKSEKYVDQMIKDGANIRVLDKTQAGQFLAKDDIFKDAWIAAGGTEAELYHGTTGPWAKASERFVAETVGEVRLLGFNATDRSVFVNTELKAALAEGSRITSIEGLTIAELRAIEADKGLNNVIEKLKLSSAEHAAISGFRVNATGGVLQSVEIGEFLERDVLDSHAYARTNPAAMQRFKDFWQGLEQAEASKLKTLARGAGKSLGAAGSVLVLGIALSESAAAAESGDTEQARQIMDLWAVDAAGSSAGAAIGGTVVAIAAGAAVAAGAVISAPVLLALGIGGAIVGGIWGSKFATDAWAEYRGSADEGELNLLEKLSAQWALSDHHLLFGTSQSDTLTGTAANDYLFGGGGDDTLNGLAGDDVLRAGVGNDVLNGGAGADRLYGGDGDDTLRGDEGNDMLAGDAGNDELVGGAGNDYLLGGAGTDTYTFSGNFGQDYLQDSDGQGVLDAQGLGPLTGQNLERTAEHTWQSADGQLHITRIVVGSRTDLVIRVSGSASNGSITIRGWSEGQLGISLGGEIQPSASFGLGNNNDLAGRNSGGQQLVTDLTHIQAGAGDDAVAVGLTLGDTRDFIVDGEAGNDILFGAAGSDLIRGGDGNDWLSGNRGADLIDGGAGADLVLPDVSHITLGGPSNGQTWQQIWQAEAALWRWQVMVGANGLRLSYGEDGSDVLSPLFRIDTGAHPITWWRDAAPDELGDTVFGGAGDDLIVGGAGADLLSGEEDADVVSGGAGDDAIYGGTGNDELDGGMGDDRLDGGGEDDHVYGGYGADTLEGGSGNDTLAGDLPLLVGGQYPQDVQWALMGDDWIDAGAGNDRVSGNGGSDTLLGGDGDDTLWGDSGADAERPASHDGDDWIDGGDGNDLMVGEGASDTLFGGAGDDSIQGDREDALLNGTAPGDDYLDGEDGNDTLAGDGGADVLIGGAGNDLLMGDNAGDIVAGSSHGNDYLDGGVGNDSLYGGGRDDSLYGGDGDDWLEGDASVENLTAAFHGHDLLDGGAGNDTLFGMGGNDMLEGGEGADYLDGDALAADLGAAFHGNDMLFGGAGDDTLVGGGGTDTLWGDAGNDRLVGDFVAGDAGAHGADWLSGGMGNDTLEGLGGDDELSGDEGADMLFGGDGADTLRGGDGDDHLSGDAGHDLLAGGSGSDGLFGGDGNDTLEGGLGADAMNGGAGDDTYVVSLADMAASGGLIDSIMDLQGSNTLVLGVNRDQIDLVSGPDGVLRIRVDDTHQIAILGATEGAIRTVRFADGSSDGMDRLIGENYAAPVVGGSSSNQAALYGGTANDSFVLAGAAVGGTISGGRGNDSIELRSTQGGTVLYSLGDGQDRIYSPSARTGQNVLRFGQGIAAASLRLSNSPLGMVIHVGTDPSDLIHLDFNSSAGERSPIDRIEFADGSSLTYAQLIAIGFDGGAGNDFLMGTNTANRINGGAGNDTLEGLGGADTLIGGAGNDTLRGGYGRDTYVFGPGDGLDVVIEPGDSTVEVDTVQVVGASPADVVLQSDGQDLFLLLEGGESQLRIANHFIAAYDYRIEQIRFEDGTVWNAAEIASRTVVVTADTMVGTAGDDHYVVDNRRDTIVEAVDGGYDRVVSSVNYTLPENVEQLTLVGPAAVEAAGNALSNLLVGNALDNVFNRNARGANNGQDTLMGGAGNDAYFVDGITGYGGQDSDDTIVELAGEGTDIMVSTSFRASLRDNVEVLIDTYWGSSYRWETGEYIPRHLRGTASNDIIAVVRASVPTLTSDPSLLATYAAQNYEDLNKGTVIVIDGGAGADTMIGSAERTTYVVDDPGDVVWEMSSVSIDTVQSSIDYTLGANLERLELTGVSAIYGTGNAGDNWLAGDENTAANTLLGGLGDDTYVLGAGDVAIERADEGFDTVILRGIVAGGIHRLSDHLNIEHLTLDALMPLGSAPVTLLGTDGDDTLTNLTREPAYSLPGGGYSVGHGGLTFGGGGNDYIVGSGGADTLDGGTGADTMMGGAESDLYRVDNSDDVVLELASSWGSNQGTDTIEASVDYVLPENVEYLVAVGGIGVRLTGNAVGGTLDGSRNAAADTLVGGTGYNHFVVDGLDQVIALAGANNSVMATEGFTMADNVQSGGLMRWAVGGVVGNDESNWIYGSDLANALFGNGGDDTLSGGEGDDTVNGGQGDDIIYSDAGNDFLVGGAGNDLYYFGYGSGQDTIDNRDALGAIDTLRVSVADPSELVLRRFGDDLLLRIGGTSDSMLLSGYFVTTQEAGVTIDARLDYIEFTYTGEIWDQAQIEAAVTINRPPVLNTPIPDQSAAHGAAFTYQVPAAAFSDPDAGDLLTLGASLADGSALPGWIVFDPTTRRFTGTPSEVGVIDVLITARDAEGLEVTDSFRITVTQQNLMLTGTSTSDTLRGGSGHDTLSGLGGNDSLVGNAGNDRLDGGSGSDTLSGGTGDDTYIVDNTGDVVSEAADEGVDLVQSSVSFTLGAHVENLTLTGTSAISATGNGLNNTLTGNSANNTLTGGAGDDWLDGGNGNDTMIGGVGDDTYVVNVSTDVVTELAGEGTDTVRSGVTLTLAANVENLVLMGSSAISGTGNALDNVLTGNGANNTLTGAAGNDTLDGGAGNDTMRGGTGDDTYFVNVSTDVVTENANEGTDTINSLVALTLGNNVENLNLIGTAAINGTGNALNNTLIGNSAANVLTGGAGNDIYDGGAGNDTFTDTSTSSSDIYRWGTGDGLDVLTDSGGSADRIDLGAGITSSNLNLARNGNHPELTVTGFTDKLTINNWYASANNQIETIRFSDGSSILASQVQSLVSAMATMSAGSQGAVESVGVRRTILPVLPTVDLAAAVL